MDAQVLVAYATKYGATGEIADKIGQVLQQTGWRVDVLPVKRVGDVAAYQAVVLGSAVYMFHWRREAAAFLKANEKALAGRPLWLFSSGPTGEGSADAFLEGRRLPDALLPIAERIAPREIAVFGGKIDPARLGFFERLIIKNVKVPTGDFRDWDAIADWAVKIAEALSVLLR